MAHHAREPSRSILWTIPLRPLLPALLSGLALIAEPAMGQQAADTAAGAAVRATTTARTTLSFGTARQVETARGETITLDQAFRAALDGSRDLEAARDRIVEAHVDIDRAWSTLRPGAYLTGSLTRNDKEVRFPQPDGGERIVQELYQHQLGASLRQVVFQGQALPTIRALRRLRESTELERERLRAEVLYAVATAFYSALALQGSLEIAERQLEGTASHLEVVRARHELEAANRLDLLRAEIDHRNAVEDLRITQASLASVKVALATLIGRPHDEGDYTVVRPDEPDAGDMKIDAALEVARDKRADLAALDRQVTAADHLVTAARMAFLPSLDLSANARYSAVTGFLRDDNITWLATLNLTLPIYQGGQRRQQLQSAKLRVRQTQRARDNLADRMRQEVIQARLDLDAATAQLERLEGTSELARESLELARARFEVGAATSLEVTDATNRAFLAETQVLRGRLDLDMAVLTLGRAVGILEEAAGFDDGPSRTD